LIPIASDRDEKSPRRQVDADQSRKGRGRSPTEIESENGDKAKKQRKANTNVAAYQNSASTIRVAYPFTFMQL
jgi:hypothetical protein